MQYCVLMVLLPYLSQYTNKSLTLTDIQFHISIAENRCGHYITALAGTPLNPDNKLAEEHGSWHRCSMHLWCQFKMYLIHMAQSSLPSIETKSQQGHSTVTIIICLWHKPLASVFPEMHISTAAGFAVT